MSIFTAPERAAQIWSVLGLAARNRQILTYRMLGKLIGVPARGLGHLLEPVQSYCLEEGLPPLTILVVQEETGLPGSGFSAATASEFTKRQLQVFDYDWLDHATPTPEQLEEAVKKRPSRTGHELESGRSGEGPERTENPGDGYDTRSEPHLGVVKDPGAAPNLLERMRHGEYMTVLLNNCHRRNHKALFGPQAFFDLDTKEAHRRQLPGVVRGTECIVATPDTDGRIDFSFYSFSCEALMPDGHSNVRVLFGDFVRTETLTREQARNTPPFSHLFASDGAFKQLSALRVTQPRERPRRP
jgi:hypothetical protein